MKMTKREFYKKPLKKCPCCKWPGSVDEIGKRKWLSVKINGHRERLSPEASKDEAIVRTPCINEDGEPSRND